MVRTTLRIETGLKKEAERLALEADTTFQEVYNQALRAYLRAKAKNKANKTIRFYTQNLGSKLDNLTRNDYYNEPKTK